ncbi:VacJ family lipoprotein [uncultured Endozoicomonas sp.]|uniref:MlaA family lipoprotein n=1 Tax=uncultured Endozoicomonas sp. TaxID=432652 RepID=UPI0026308C95|nr:VacJ family lipoprotein [uncultured Endozoicomonas sp.]
MLLSSINLARSLATTALILLSGAAFAAQPVSYDDPFEGWNRKVFKFNDTLDTYALKPVAKTYDYIAPQPVQTVVTNFFSNLGEIRNIASNGLQLKGRDTFASAGRLIINSTIGIFGLLDVATLMGIDKRYSDFGLTFAQWGVPSGPYLVLPLFGPKTTRSGFGLVPDSLSNPVTYHHPDSERYALSATDLINTRAKLLEAEDLIVGDRYTFIRDTYLQRREFMITGEQPEDDF